MATQEALETITLIAAADLTAKQFYGVKVDSSGYAAIAGAGEACIGILQNKPDAGQPATIAICGKSKAIAGGSMTIGGYVATNASGKFVTATKGKTDTSDTGAAADPLIGSNVVGILMAAAGADGDITEVLIQPMGAVPTTAA